MGVSGAGKTTVAQGLVQRLGWDFAEGDDAHPPANKAKMAAGIALVDADRWPWLAALAAWIGRHEESGASAIVTCSALRRAYRDVLREGHPSVWFAHVEAPHSLLAHRLEHRRGHYMPASLLGSQLETLELLQPDEPGVVVSGAGTPAEVVERVIEALDRHRRGDRPDEGRSQP